MNVNVLIKQFFTENEYHKIADRLVVLRSDGINIYSNIEDRFEASSIGALVSGLWQAAESLSSLLKSNHDYYDFRLGFDTSSDGLYVLPFKMMGKTFYICSIYKDSENPGKLKRNIRLLKENLEIYVSSFKVSKDAKIDVNRTNNKSERNEFLFDAISDEEMDRLFAFGGM